MSLNPHGYRCSAQVSPVCVQALGEPVPFLGWDTGSLPGGAVVLEQVPSFVLVSVLIGPEPPGRQQLWHVDVCPCCSCFCAFP